MRAPRNTRLDRIAAIAAILLCVPSSMLAQQAQDQPEANDETVEEVIVYGPRSGDPVDIDALYLDQLRKRILNDYFLQQRLMERARWRSSLDTKVKSPSRIRWGYDPGAELRMRRETDLMDLPFETNKPATIFRLGF